MLHSRILWGAHPFLFESRYIWEYGIWIVLIVRRLLVRLFTQGIGLDEFRRRDVACKLIRLINYLIHLEIYLVFKMIYTSAYKKIFLFLF